MAVSLAEQFADNTEVIDLNEISNKIKTDKCPISNRNIRHGHFKTKNGIPIKIQAVANPGYNFLHWGNNPLITDTLNAYFLDTLSSNPIAFNAYFEEIDDVGIDDFAPSSNWTIFPNPANSQLFIKNEILTS